ncbi:MAG: DNA primase [Bacteroidetes bacterium]|nr:DNA primase [Bacteroidota bacterium]
MKIPQEKIDEIRAASDVVDVISAYVRLKKRGKDYLGLCPFHQEKTPSFSVSAQKQMFYCFGCHRGGDVVKFVMEYEKSSYVEALEQLAERAGITITRTEESYEAANEMERLYAVMSFAARFFYHNLTKTTEGEFALNYFRERGFTAQTMTTFGLGYAMRGWDSLIKKAAEEGIAPEMLEKVGLVRKKEDGGTYDTFRGRAMFPIFSTNGRVIAFGARKLYEDDKLGKYINSSETPIYHKSKVLYGLSQAKDAIRERDFAVLVEGYADLISVHQAGTRNIVASSGTALTPEQIQLVARYTKNITLVYDADSAGANAMLRGVDLVLEGGLDVRIVRLPEGEDPDSFVRKHGGEAFEELLKKAVSFIDYKAGEFMRSGSFDTPEGKAEAVRGLVQSIAKIPDQLKRSFFIKAVAEKYELYESTLYAEMEKSTRRVPQKFVQTAAAEEPAEERETKLRVAAAEEMPTEERDLLTAVLEDPKEMVPFVFRSLQPSDLTHPASRRIADAVLLLFDETGEADAAQVMEQMETEQERTIVANLSFHRYQLSDRWSKIGSRASDTRLYEMALGAIKAVKKKQLEHELADNRHRMKLAAAAGGDTMEFLRRQQEILAALKEIDGLTLMKG